MKTPAFQWLVALAVVANGCSCKESVSNIAPSLGVTPAGVDFASRRGRVPAIEFRARYGPADLEFEPAPGTLEHFLMERYCLYTRWHGGRILRLDVQHPPWRVSSAAVEIAANTRASMQGIGLDPSEAPIAHFSKRQDTVAWRPAPIGRR